MEGSRFADLAPELRNRIWKAALHHGRLTVHRVRTLQEFEILREETRDPDCWEDDEPAVALKQSCDDFPRDPTALLQTCKQIRDEASQIFYATNTFVVFLPDPRNVAIIHEFRAAIGEKNSKAVRTMIAKPMEEAAKHSGPPVWHTYLQLPALARLVQSVEYEFGDMVPSGGRELKGLQLVFSGPDWRLSFERAVKELQELRANERYQGSFTKRMMAFQLVSIVMDMERRMATPYFPKLSSKEDESDKE